MLQLGSVPTRKVARRDEYNEPPRFSPRLSSSPFERGIFLEEIPGTCLGLLRIRTQPEPEMIPLFDPIPLSPWDMLKGGSKLVMILPILAFLALTTDPWTPIAFICLTAIALLCPGPYPFLAPGTDCMAATALFRTLHPHLSLS